MKTIIAMAMAALAAACAPVVPIHKEDAAWRQVDSYGTGQRGTAPNGGRGTVYQRDTPRAPTTPGGGD